MGTGRYAEGTPLGFIHLRALREGRYGWSACAYAESDASGRFSLRGDAAPGAYHIACDHPFWRMEPRDSTPGERDVALVLRPAGRLWGELSTGVPGTVRDIEIALKGADGETRAIAPDYFGSFSAPSLVPGSYAVTVASLPRRETLAHFEGVDVPAGGDTHDPRLRSIDLSSRAEPCTVRVTGADGEPVAGAAVWTRCEGPMSEHGPSWAETSTDSRGEVRIATFGSPLRVLAGARGLRFAEAGGVRDVVELRLVPASEREVVVRLVSRVSLPPPPLSVGLGLVWSGTAERPVTGFTRFADPRNRGRGFPTIDADRTARFRVSEPGRYTARLHVFRSEGSGGSGGAADAATSTEVLVGDGLGPYEILVSIDDEGLRAGFESLSR